MKKRLQVQSLLNGAESIDHIQNEGKMCRNVVHRSGILLPSILLVSYWLHASCTILNPFGGKEDVNVTLNIPLPQQNGLQKKASITAISKVIATVSSGGQVLTEKELLISGRSASGTLSVPAGPNRTFTVEALDANAIVQWRGETTTDIEGSTFDVKITLQSLPPTPVALQAISISYNSVTLSWTPNLDPDFFEYKLFRSSSPTEFGVTLLATSDNKETGFEDRSVSSGTYYYRVLMIDTEGFSTSSNVLQVIVPEG